MTRATERPAYVGARLDALGTYVHLLVTDPAALHEARTILVRQLGDLDAACSRFRADSEVIAVERRAGWSVEVSPLLAHAVAVALRAADLTDGDLDPTVGAALCRLGYDRDFAAVATDGPAVVVSHGPQPRWYDVELDEDRRRLTVPPGVRLDLGATAKAWAADRAAGSIAATTGCGVLVNLGGDVAVSGSPPAAGWAVRVADQPEQVVPAPRGRGTAGDRIETNGDVDPTATVAIVDGGLATSSTSVRRWRRGGSDVHHIVDPTTGLPAPSPWRNVSVVAGSCLDANIASTTAIIRGTGAYGWLAHLGLPARLVDTAGCIDLVGGWPRGQS